MNYQDIANQLHKHEEARDKRQAYGFERLKSNNALQDLIHELEEHENE